MPPFLTDENRAEVTSLQLLIPSVSSLSKMPIRESNSKEPNQDLISSSLLDGANYDEWTTILSRLVLVSKLLSSRKKKFESIDGNITKRCTTLQDSTTRHSAIHNLLDRLYWLLREEVTSTREDTLLCHDRLSFLPESLLCHILSFLTTKEAVRTSVLSSSWRNLWQWVPSLDLERSDFPNDKACVDFINNFLPNFKSLSGFRLRINRCLVEKSVSLYKTCLGNLINRKIQHFQVSSYHFTKLPVVALPVCEALVSLKLCFVRLNEFESLSLPCLKVLQLEYVTFPSDAVLDTPRLEQLILTDYEFKTFKKISMSDSAEVDINVSLFKQRPYDLSDRNDLYNFLNNFSAVRDMTLSWFTLELIYWMKDMNPLLKFRDLTRLSANMGLEDCLKLVPFVLERCPNLKHLTLELIKVDDPEAVTDSLSNVLSFCLVSSLEYVEIESPITDEARERELVGYFLDNATSLKKLVLRLNVSAGEKHDPGLLKQRFDSPRRSNLCQFNVLLVVQTPDMIEEL